jgi:hypothetical protein
MEIDTKTEEVVKKTSLQKLYLFVLVFIIIISIAFISLNINLIRLDSSENEAEQQAIPVVTSNDILLSAPKFEDYEATEICKGEIAQPDYERYYTRYYEDFYNKTNNPYYNRKEEYEVFFKQVISSIDSYVQKARIDAKEKGPGFGGCYSSIIEQDFRPPLVMNLKTGELIELPNSNITGTVQSDSFLLVINPHLGYTEFQSQLDRRPVEYFLLQNGKFKKIYEEPCLPLNGKIVCGEEKDALVSKEDIKSFSNDEFGFKFNYRPAFWGDLYFKKPYFINILFAADTLNWDDNTLGGDQIFYGLTIQSRKDIENLVKEVENSETGDAFWVIDTVLFDKEKSLLENSSKDGFVDCPDTSDPLCEIRTIGGNRFLIEYNVNSWKGITTQILYVIFHNNIRYEFSGDGFYTEKVAIYSGGEFGKWNFKPEIQKSIETGNLPLTKNGELLEELLESLSFF